MKRKGSVKKKSGSERDRERKEVQKWWVVIKMSPVFQGESEREKDEKCEA